MLDFKRLKTCA